MEARMRAEEGDESVQDYADEGRQALGRIKSSQSRLGSVARRFAALWRGRHAKDDQPD
jgi:hypothetical protein